MSKAQDNTSLLQQSAEHPWHVKINRFHVHPLKAVRSLMVIGLMTGLIACGGGGGGGSGDGGSGTGGSGSSGTDSGTTAKASLVAVPDATSTQQGTRVVVKVLANDSGFDDGIPTISIASGPKNGKVVIRSDGAIAYTPASGFSGVDTFVYKITDGSDRSALATASVRVTCTDCSNSDTGSVTLKWNPVPGAVLGYLVYYAEGLVRDPASVTTIIAKNKVTFDTQTDLGLSPGDYACFWVQSVNQAGVSALSAPACGVV